MLRSLILSASNRCFLSCPGCYNHFGQHVAAAGDVVSFVRLLHARIPLRKLTVGGGDPLTRPDIIELLAGLRHLGLRIHLDTVGSAFLGSAPIRFRGHGSVPQVDASVVARLVDLVGIPLDGSTDEVFRRFRRFASVAEQESVLDVLADAGATICVNTVVHQGNHDDVPRIAAILGTHPQVREWQLFQFMPIGPLGYRNRHGYQISEAVFDAAVRNLQGTVPATVRIVAKSASSRKHRYLLMDSAGMLWTPRQQGGGAWTITDANDDRATCGTIEDPSTLDRLAAIFAPDVPRQRRRSYDRV
ncbi:MAG: radical SAM protein [Dactylosporangium sp.]|nr:radical SAM protein [Dactylosporangium sp.]NNJ62163.1 radical SAM protein [Dactylosporangium sp.]